MSRHWLVLVALLPFAVAGQEKLTIVSEEEATKRLVEKVEISCPPGVKALLGVRFMIVVDKEGKISNLSQDS